MVTGRLLRLFAFLSAFAAALLSTPLAAAQTLDEVCSSNSVCLIFVALGVLMLVYTYYRAKREAERAAQRGPAGSQPQMAEPVPKGYEQEPSYGTTPYTTGAPGYNYAPQPQGAPGYPSAPSAPGAPGDYSPVLLVQESSSSRKSKAAGTCPRCGATDLVTFETGEHKCNNCKKIFMD